MNEAKSSRQSFERWFPVPDVPRCFGGYSLDDGIDGLQVILHPARGSDRDLVLTFGRAVVGYRVFNEFTHPRFHQEPSPEPSPEFPWGTYPLLVVRGSDWLASFTDSQLAPWFDQVVHYFIYTLDRSLDVLSHVAPTAHWQMTTVADPNT